MAVKTITIRDDVYRALLMMKKEGESFSELLERLTRKRGIEDLFGALKEDITEEDVRKLYDERKHAWVRV